MNLNELIIYPLEIIDLENKDKDIKLSSFNSGYNFAIKDIKIFNNLEIELDEKKVGDLLFKTFLRNGPQIFSVGETLNKNLKDILVRKEGE